MTIPVCPACGSTTPERIEAVEGSTIIWVCHTDICDNRFEVEATGRLDILRAKLSIIFYYSWFVAMGLLMFVAIPIAILVALIQLVRFLG